MKQLLPVSSYKGYVFSIVPLNQLSGEVLTMVYTKGSIKAGMLEFDISTKKYKSVTAVERADKNYFIILIPKSTTISDSAIAQLKSSFFPAYSHRSIPHAFLDILSVPSYSLYYLISRGFTEIAFMDTSRSC